MLLFPVGVLYKTGLDRRQSIMKNQQRVRPTKLSEAVYSTTLHLGHDDTSQLSQSALEGRYSSEHSKEIR